MKLIWLLTVVIFLAVPKVSAFTARHRVRSDNVRSDDACGRVSAVPRNERWWTECGLRYAHFYQKYTHAYGIPILASAQSSDAALKRSCYMAKVLLADRYDVRRAFFKNCGRLAIIGAREGTTHIPAHAYLPAWWNQRARGLGGTLARPVSSAGEENLLCYPNDRYRVEDIGLHEFVHGIVNVGVAMVDRGFVPRIKRALAYAKSRGLWANTYADDTWEEYFAEGAQSFFNVNAYANPPNGIHNHVDKRDKLRTYDPTLYKLVREVFPCMNQITDRCKKGTALLMPRMNCDGKGGGTKPETCQDKDAKCTGWKNFCTAEKYLSWMKQNCCKTCKSGGKPIPKATPRPRPQPTCVDKESSCAGWKKYCTASKYQDYMKKNCCKTCRSNCKDKNSLCAGWAYKGECTKNPAYMIPNCAKSCKQC